MLLCGTGGRFGRLAGAPYCMDGTIVLQTLLDEGCDIVVVGSMARRLLGEPVTPQDLDVVVDPAPDNRRRLLRAFASLGACVERRRGRLPVGPNLDLSWEWGWRAVTAHGRVDVIVRFIDGSTIDDHRRHSTLIKLPSGRTVRCHATHHEHRSASVHE